MKYVSTSCSGVHVGLAEAVGSCVAPDGGLFMPADIRPIPKAFFNNIGDMNLRDIAYVVATTMMGDDIEPSELKSIVDAAFSFDAPMRHIGDNRYVLELFHGPTLTFKDYGARFMARLLKSLDKGQSKKRNIIVATTGNTGAAAANGLFKLDGVSVTVLYPKGRLSRTQTAQIAALGENIHPVEIAGSVEDCKALMQKAIADPSMSEFRLTGANSINIARLIPQISFSLYAYGHLKALDIASAENAFYAIPAGNLSNITATAMAIALGLPCGGIIAATTPSNQLPTLLAGGSVDPTQRPAASLAPSIDISIPSGWPRLEMLYNGDLEAMRRHIRAVAVDDNSIASAICNLRYTASYTLDPHSAAAYAASSHIPSDIPTVIFATGHPAKQLDIMTRITGSAIELPVQLTRFMSCKRHPAIIPPTLPALKKHLSSIN